MAEESSAAAGRIDEIWSERQQVFDADGGILSATVYYLVFDLTTEKDVLNFAVAHVPASISEGGRIVYLGNVNIEQRLTETVWKVAAEYPSATATTESGGEVPEFSLDISSGSKHITHAKVHIGSYAPSGKTAPDYGGAINVDAENKVNGVDIVSCNLSFSEKHFFTDSQMSTSFKLTLSDLAGCVNSGAFRGWSAGEVLFVGASGSRRGKTSKDKWEITFRFAVSKNATSIHIDDITIPSKRGWDYLWVKYADDVDGNKLTKKVVAAYVEQVYDYASFNALD